MEVDFRKVKQVLNRRTLVLAGIGLPLLFLIVYFSFRNYFLNQNLEKVKSKLEKNGHYSVIEGESGFSGLFSLEFSNFGLVSLQTCDTLLFARHAELSFSPLRGLFGGSWINDLVLEDMQVHYAWQEIKTGETQTSDTQTETETRNFSIEQVLGFIPEKVRLQNLTLSISNSIEQVKYFIPSFEKNELEFSGELYCTSLTEKSGFVLSTDKENGKLIIHTLSSGKGKLLFPFYDNILFVGFDTTQITFKDKEAEMIPLLVQANHLDVFFPRLSSDTIRFKSPELLFNLSVQKENFGIEKGSYIANNGVKLFLSCLKKGADSGVIEANLNMPEVPANKFFGALPQGLFTRSSRFRAEGSFLFSLHLLLNPQVPDSLQFEVSFTGNKVRGLVQDLSRINDSFQHTVIEEGRPVASFLVGPENPDFVPYAELNPFLISAVLNSEDGSFFSHRGFYPDAIRESLIENFKAGEFVRGGSTISMQLVKNVFLQRDKTIGRKAEEALLVWLIEQYRLVSKERMLEVYFNIIEWGPGIYGIGNASKFYFNKSCATLSLAECIYLSAIIPSPKKFRYRFDAFGHLQSYLAPYYSILSGKMLRKGQISETDAAALIPDVELTGPAKLYLKTIPDTLESLEAEPLPAVDQF